MDTSEQYYRMCYEAFPEDRKRGVVFKTQDQLQEMVGGFGGFEEFYNEFCFPYEGEFGIPQYMGSCTSMEQLWLAFVMKEKYQKVWDGNDWIKNPLS